MRKAQLAAFEKRVTKAVKAFRKQGGTIVSSTFGVKYTPKGKARWLAVPNIANPGSNQIQCCPIGALLLTEQTKRPRGSFWRRAREPHPYCAAMNIKDHDKAAHAQMAFTCGFDGAPDTEYLGTPMYKLGAKLRRRYLRSPAQRAAGAATSEG